MAATRTFNLHATTGPTARDALRTRAFTLLEMVLAVAVASVLMVAALAMMTAIQRNESLLSRRADESGDLQRLRLVLQRTFSTMLVSQSTVTSPGSAATAVAQPVDESGGASAGSSADVPPRVWLDVDGELATSSTHGVMVLDRAGQVLSQVPQRLEIVLIDPPVPTQGVDVFQAARAIKRETRKMGFLDRRAMNEQDLTADAASGPVVNESGVDVAVSAEPEQDEEADSTVRAVRGMFELRPQEPRRGETFAQAVYELWWVPIGARRSVEEIRGMTRMQRRIEAISAGDPFMISQNITFLRIRMFDDREKKTRYSAVYQKDLPAYVEVDVQTRSGLSAEWLFEVGWVVGPETGRQAELARQAMQQRQGETVRGASGTREGGSATTQGELLRGGATGLGGGGVGAGARGTKGGGK